MQPGHRSQSAFWRGRGRPAPAHRLALTATVGQEPARVHSVSRRRTPTPSGRTSPLPHAQGRRTESSASKTTRDDVLVTTVTAGSLDDLVEVDRLRAVHCELHARAAPEGDG